MDPRTLADEDIMPLVRAGDADAFAALYDRHADVAFSLAYRITGTRSRAEDVTQEAFLSIWRGGGRYDAARGSVRTWVLGIVHHRAIDAIRRESVHGRRRADDDSAAERLPAAERTDELVSRRLDSETVHEALGGLPADQSQVIDLAYFGGFTQTEIADMLQLPLGTVKGRMRLGLGKMRDALAGAAL